MKVILLVAERSPFARVPGSPIKSNHPPKIPKGFRVWSLGFRV